LLLRQGIIANLCQQPEGGKSHDAQDFGSVDVSTLSNCHAGNQGKEFHTKLLTVVGPALAFLGVKGRATQTAYIARKTRTHLGDFRSRLCWGETTASFSSSTTARFTNNFIFPCEVLAVSFGSAEHPMLLQSHKPIKGASMQGSESQDRLM
jgi:hypothetical protein